MKQYKLSTDQLTDWFILLQALYVLIKQMNCNEKLVVDALLEQLSTAYNWKVRMLFHF